MNEELHNKPTSRVRTRAPRRAKRRAKIDLSESPNSPDELHALVSEVFDVYIPREPLLEGNAAPFDYLIHTFFEAPGLATGDCVVWANRGGGKTFLGAIASVLDAVFKNGIQIRILGGSLEQSGRMHEHVMRLFEKPLLAELVEGRATSKRVRLINGSGIEVLAASQRSVRGTRVQKIRCDEVDLFDPEVWSAAQLATRSAPIKGPWGECVRGTVEALSTMHRPYGLMWELVGARTLGEKLTQVSRARKPIAQSGVRRVLRWGLLDVLEKCPLEADCGNCALWSECRGKAKLIEPPPGGHVRVSDAGVMKSRVDQQTWAAEMLCQRPRRADAVYPEFEIETHVVRVDPVREEPRSSLDAPSRRFIAGMDFGFRSEAVMLLASVDERGVVTVEREHAASGMRTREHVEVLKSWLEDGHAPGGLEWIGVDPAGRAKSDQTGESNVGLLRKEGIVVRSRASAIDDGIRRVRARLAPASWATMSEWEREANGQDGPRLYVHERCERLIECLQRYHYPSDKPESTEPVKDGFDHACDALRYMVVNLDAPGGVSVRKY